VIRSSTGGLPPEVGYDPDVFADALVLFAGAVYPRHHDPRKASCIPRKTTRMTGPRAAPDSSPDGRRSGSLFTCREAGGCGNGYRFAKSQGKPNPAISQKSP
jgi:hypothetical protein